MYNRCSLPRIVAKDVQEEVNLGDSDEVAGEDPEHVVPEPMVSKKEARLARMRDLENYGQEKSNEVVDDVTEDDEVDQDVLSEGDDETIQCLVELQDGDEEDVVRQKVQGV